MSSEQSRGGGRMSAFGDYDSSLMLSGTLSNTPSPSTERMINPSFGQEPMEEGALALIGRNDGARSNRDEAVDNDVESIELEESLHNEDGADKDWENISNLGVISSASSPLCTTGFDNPEPPRTPQWPLADRLSTNDVDGAMHTLQPSNWLSTTAIQLTLDKCHTDGVRVFNPSFLSVTTGKYLSRGTGEDRIWIIPLLFKEDHWTLITIDITTESVEFWNSLPTPEYEAEAQEAVQDLERSLNDGACHYLHGVPGVNWSLTAKSCPVQINSSDCGVYTIVFALYKLLDITISQLINHYLWRQVLCSCSFLAAESATDSLTQVSSSATVREPNREIHGTPLTFAP